MFWILFWVQSAFSQIGFPHGTAGGGDDIVKAHGLYNFSGQPEWYPANIQNGKFVQGGMEKFMLTIVPVWGTTNGMLNLATTYDSRDDFFAPVQLVASEINVKVNGAIITVLNPTITLTTLNLSIPAPEGSMVEIEFTNPGNFFMISQEGNPKNEIINRPLLCGEVVTPATLNADFFIGGTWDRIFSDQRVTSGSDLGIKVGFGAEQFRLWYLDAQGNVYQQRYILYRGSEQITDTVAICPTAGLTGFQPNNLISVYRLNGGNQDYLGLITPSQISTLLEAGQTYRVYQAYQSGGCNFEIVKTIFVKNTYTLSVLPSCDRTVLRVPGCADCEWTVNNGTPLVTDSLVFLDADGPANVTVSSNTDSTCFNASYQFSRTPYVAQFRFVQTCDSINVALPSQLAIGDSSIVVYGADTTAYNVRTLSIAFNPSITRIELRGTRCDSTYTGTFVPRTLGPECGGSATLAVSTDPCGNAQITSNWPEVSIRKAGITGSRIVSEANTAGEFKALKLDPGTYTFTAGNATQTLTIVEDVFDPSTILTFAPTDSSIRVFIDRSLLPVGYDSVYVKWNGAVISTTYQDLNFENQGMLEVFTGSASCGFQGQKVLIPRLACLGTGLGIDPDDEDIIPPGLGDLSVSPNPVLQAGILTIKSPEIELSKAVLYSALGVNLWVSSSTFWEPYQQGNKGMLDLSSVGNLSAGTYFLRLEWLDNGMLRTEVKKIVIQ